MENVTPPSDPQNITFGKFVNTFVNGTLPSDLQNIAFGVVIATMENVTPPCGPQNITFGKFVNTFVNVTLPSGLKSLMYLDDNLRVLPEILGAMSTCGDVANPVMTVIAMGWNWAFHLAQAVREHVCSIANPGSDRIRDREPVPALSPSKSSILLYADNANHLSLSRRVCNNSRARLSEELNKLNLTTHEIEEANCRGVTLGVVFDGQIGLVRATPERDANLTSVCWLWNPAHLCILTTCEESPDI